MAKELRRLLNNKDSAHYGTSFVSRSEAQNMLGWAARLIGLSQVAVEV